MGGVAEWRIFCEAAATELRILHRADGVAISIDEVHCSSNTNRSTLGIDEDLHILAHQLALSRGNREVLVNVMGGATSTLSLIRSDEYVHE